MHRFASLLVIAAIGGCSSVGQIFYPTRQPLSQEAKLLGVDAADLPRELRKTLQDPYVVEPGDGLLLLPADLDSPVRLPSDQTVLGDGTIDLGKYGRLPVAGRTLPEIEDQVGVTVRKLTPEAGFIDVRLVNRQSKSFYVLGEVNTPGKYPLTGADTVLDAILAAGGLTDRASWRNILLVRPTCDGPGLVLRVDYTAVTQLGAAANNYQLKPGDRVFVPSRGFREHLSDHNK